MCGHAGNGEIVHEREAKGKPIVHEGNKGEKKKVTRLISFIKCG